MTDLTPTRIDILVAAYTKLIKLLREKGDPRLSSLADSADRSLEQLKTLRAQGVDLKTKRAMQTGLKQGLREMPALLASFAPECHSQLVREFEDCLGQKFSEF